MKDVCLGAVLRIRVSFALPLQPVNVFISLLLLKNYIVVAGKRQRRKLMSLINNTQGSVDSK